MQFVMPDPGSSPGRGLIRHPVFLWLPVYVPADESLHIRKFSVP